MIKQLQSMLVFLLILGTWTPSSAQTTYADHWDLVLKNERKKASKTFKKTANTSLESLLTNEILRNENGRINGGSDGFLKKFIAQKDFEYYMYALWNKPFIFDNYIRTGFHQKNLEAINVVASADIQVNAAKHSFEYLRGIAARSNQDFEGYYRALAKIPSINDWQFCGTFENMNQSGLDIAYEPEEYPKSDKLFSANSNGEVGWYTPHAMFKEEPYQFLSNHLEYGYGVNYAQTFIRSEKKQRVVLLLGNSSAFKVWMNDVQVFENSKNMKTDLDAYAVELTLDKGYNRLLIKNAERDGTPYFIARITDLAGNEIPELQYSSAYKKYKKATQKSVNPKRKDHEVVSFFQRKIKENPNNFLYQFCLIHTFLRNENYEQAKAVLNPILKKYPNSSMLRLLQTYVHSYEGNYDLVTEVNKNIEKEDPDYYYALLKKSSELKELQRMDMESLEAYLAKMEAATDQPIMTMYTRLMMGVRSQNMAQLREVVDEMVENYEDRVQIQIKFIPFYDTMFGDKEKTVQLLEALEKKRYKSSLALTLVRYYDKLGRKEDAINVLKRNSEAFAYDNYFLKTLVEKLHDYKMYEESIPYIEQILKNYPYSFRGMKLMGEALVQTGKKEKAISYFEKSLFYNNTDRALHKRLQTLLRRENLVEKELTQNIYEYLEAHRGKYTENNYGVNILLDNTVTQLFDNGSAKIRSILAYEVTTESGVEGYKEYDLGLSGNYQIIKAEIVKKDKTIKTAERKGSSFVFNGLEIGDLLLIEYELNSTGSGRFYKDFTDLYQFDSESFCLKTNYTLIVPKGMKFDAVVENGDLEYKKKAVDDYEVHSWELLNAKEMKKSESYGPVFSDYARMLHISTIKSWGEIANWYSDLVRSQLESNAEVDKVFNSLFSKERLSTMSDEAKAKKIYEYIMDNFNYSHVNFKQSGFVPQKPFKTITTKLGDCKDFSTLFTVLAQKAGLKTTMVLVLTSDYGKKKLILPSQDFNHCIVKVMMDGKAYYLELTNKNLPFKAIPNSLLNATTLEIPYKATKETLKRAKLVHLTAPRGKESEYITKVKMRLKEDKTQDIKVHTEVRGAMTSWYRRTFNEANKETVKEAILKDFKGAMGKEALVQLDTLKNIAVKTSEGAVVFDAELTAKQKMNKIGRMKIMKLPLVIHTYNPSIIDVEKRSYPIVYQNYENNDHYYSEYEITAPAGKDIVEYPENASLTYKKHSYSIRYSKPKKGVLKVVIEGRPSKQNITVAEYPAFKTYIQQVLEAKDIVIGIK